jgi:DNA-binding GntR family transcriptional regulator
LNEVLLYGLSYWLAILLPIINGLADYQRIKEVTSMGANRSLENMADDYITVAEAIFIKLRQAIIDHHFLAGSKLVVDALSKHLNTSRTPVIEALNRLKQEGLLTYSPHHGYQVVEVNSASLPDLLDGRTICEVYGATRWFGEIEDRSLSGLRDAIEQMETLAKHPGTSYQWYGLEIVIHRSLVALAHNPVVSSWHERCMGVINLVWPLVPTAETPNISAPSIAEYCQILAGLESRNQAATEEAIRQHGNAEMKRLVSFTHSLRFL